MGQNRMGLDSLLANDDLHSRDCHYNAVQLTRIEVMCWKISLPLRPRISSVCTLD
jgi:hypothetical protein